MAKSSNSSNRTSICGAVRYSGILGFETVSLEGVRF